MENEKLYKEYLKELQENNHITNKLIEKIGHLVIFGIAIYLANGGEGSKHVLVKIALLLSALLVIGDDVQILLHYLHRNRKRD